MRRPTSNFIGRLAITEFRSTNLYIITCRRRLPHGTPNSPSRRPRAVLARTKDEANCGPFPFTLFLKPARCEKEMCDMAEAKSRRDVGAPRTRTRPKPDLPP